MLRLTEGEQKSVNHPLFEFDPERLNKSILQGEGPYRLDVFPSKPAIHMAASECARL